MPRNFSLAQLVRRLILGAAFCLPLSLATVSSAQNQCVGDCDVSDEVTVDEIITMVNLALNGGITGCATGDSNGDEQITVDEILTAVNNALIGCDTGGDATCGNGVKEGDEDCDDGGVCIGGDNAGTACDSESDCQGTGVCVDGPATGRTCSSNDDCDGSTCVHCKTFGGDGCAANCTNETTVALTLKPGVMEGFDIADGTSGVVVFSSFLDIPLPLNGGLSATVGRERNGITPIVIPADSINLPAIPVLSLACACVGGAPAKTCGGVVFEEDGVSLADDCTTDESACNGKKPCAPLHGPGNTMSGIIGCNGLDDVNLDAVMQNGDLTFGLSGSGGPGSALVVASINIRLVLGACTGSGGEYGADGMFCTADDPPTDLVVVGTGPTTTGEACGTVKGETPEFDLGPKCKTGAPATCTGGTADLSGACLVTALPFGGVPQIGDVVGTITLCAQ